MFFKKFTKFQMILMLIVILSTNLLAQDNIDKNPNEMVKSSQMKRTLTKASPLTTDSSIIFLHHSTGRNVYYIGNVEEWFDEYNTTNNTNFSITERDYPATPYPHDNYPYDYWNLWVTENEDTTIRIPACDSENPNIECLDSLTSNYDIIIFKQCYPGAAIGADTGSPNIASSSKRIENYKLQYRALRREMDKYPDNTFIVWTLVPLHRLATDPNQPLRAKEFVDWVKNDFLTEDDQDHSNIHIFDFWGIVAEDQENPPNGQVNTLKYEYEGSHTGSDSHPNNLASQTAGPIFSQFIVDTILNAGTNLRLSNGLPDGVLPSGTTETLLSVNTNIDSVCRYSDSPLTYTEMTNTFANTNASIHSTPISGLEDEQSYEFYIKCMDADNNTNTNNYTIDFYVNSSNPALEIDIRISNSTDDAEQYVDSGSVGLASSDLELIRDASDMLVGLRFPVVEIPKNAFITNAYIQFTVDEQNSEETSLVIKGHASDNAPTFTTVDFEISSRPTTAAFVQWDNIPPWLVRGTSNTDQRTPDLKSIVQEIVNQENWSINNAMAFIISGSGKRVAVSADQNARQAALLHIEFKTEQVTKNDLYISDLMTSDITSTGFNVSVNFEGDDNSNSLVTLYYCNDSVSSGCNPEAASFLTMTRSHTVYTSSVSGLVSPNKPGDHILIRVIAEDDDGVTGSPLNSSLNLSEASTEVYLSDASPDGTLPPGTTETTLSVNTNVDSVCRYSNQPETFAEMTNTFANTDATTHSTPITGLQNGKYYSFYIKCQDADNNTNADDYIIDFNVEPSSPASEIDIRISNFIDDAEEILSSGSVGLASSDLELVFDAEPMAVGLRFNDVEIPKNALITNAYIQFTVDEDNSEDTSLIINGHASDNAPEFTTIDFGITTREKTAATVQWENVPPWNGKGTMSTDQRTPDLKSIVQEIVNNDNWSIHNSMAFIFTGSGKRVAISFDQNPGKAPLLHVEFKTDQTQTNDITLSNLVTTDITRESFNASVDFEGDDNSNALVTLYYCNNTVSNGCDPEAATSVHMIRSNGFYETSVSGLVSPGDDFNIRIIAQDVDGVYASPLNSRLSLADADTTPPFSVSNANATNGNERSVLSWTNPDDNDFSGVIILQSESAIESIPTNGNIYNVNDMIGNAFVIYNHSGNTHTVTNLLNDTTYYFKIFAYDTSANYAQGIALNATPTAPQIVEGNRMTERFGGSASTLDHQDVMKDTWFSIYSPSSGEVLYHDYGKPYDVAEGMARRNAVYIDVSSIPQGTHIFKARFVIQIEPDYPLSYNSYADGLSLYKITDPSGTGLWVEDDLNVSYKNRTLQLPWTDQGGSFADVIDPNPIDTVYGTMQKKSFYFFDVTDLVQTWVNHPQENVGVTFDGTIPSDEKENPELRPFLEITYEAINTDRPSQPSNFNVFHRSGQNFMTWTEIDYDGYFYNMYYRIYRHTSPINNENLNDAELVGKVHQLSSYNAGRTEARKRADSSYTTQHNYIINEGEDELSDDTGLFVYNVPQEGNYYYAVTSVVEGNENRTDFSDENSLNAPITDAPGFPEAILQGSTTHNGTIVQEFVHFTTASMNYRQGHGFNFMMNVSGSYSSENPTFLEVGLGGRSTRYYGTDSSNGGIYIQPDTYMPPTENAPWDGYEYDPLQTWWSGCSNTYKTQKGIKNGVFVPYTENRILFYIEFAKTKYNIDENRIYLRGGSMGGTGTMSLGLKHPEVFASLSATVGCPNWKYNIDAVDENYVVIDEGWRLNGNALWGTLEDNLLHENGTPIWDWMNAGWYAMNNIEKEMPFIEMNNGKKDDSVRHYAIPQFYEDMKNSKHGFAARFYDGGHSGYGSIFTPRFATFVKNESFPALRNVSIDDNVGAIHEPTGIAIVTDFESALQIFDGDIEGTINGYYDIEWSRKLKEFDNISDVDDMIDLNDRYEIALRLEGISDHNTATMDITPRRLQNFDVIPGQTYYWENKQLSTGNIVQSGTIIADEYGLITVPGFSIEKSTWGNKLIITSDQGHQDKPVIALSESNLNFQADEGGSNPPSQTITVHNDGFGQLSWTATVSSQTSWINLRNATGEDSDSFTIDIDISNLIDGQYHAQIEVIDENASNSPQIINVLLNIANVEGYLHTVNVSTVSQLQNAIGSLQSNTQILVDDGHYPLSRILVIGNGVQNVALKGKSGNRDDVVIQASGMEDSAVEHAIMIRNAQDVLIADLTVRDTYYHTIMIQGEQGAAHPVLRNLHLIDSGEQFIKVTYGETGEHCDNGIVENCLIEYTDHARIHPYRNDYYTQGVDVHRGSNWIIRDNIFRNIRAPHDSGMLAGAAIIMWNQSKNTIVERNRFLECDIGIQFGNPGGAENDHEFGIIRNNFFYRAPESTGDTGISLNRARHSKVYNNTIILNNTFPWTIEYRYTNTYGEIVGDIRYNLSDGPILSRNDAPGSEIGNITTAESTWFKDSINGDLHLVSTATDAIDNALLLPEVMDDIDNDQRLGLPDIGADEYLDDTLPPQTHLLQPSDLIYKGAFRLPGPSNGISWSYAGGSSYGGGDMTYYPDGDSANEDTDDYPGSIFGIGKANDLNYISEISIPAPVISPDKDVNDLNTATTLQPFTDIRSFELGASTPTTTGIEYLPAQGDQETGKLYSSWGEYYQFSGGFLSQSWSELDLSNPQTKGGWFLGDGQNPHNMSISGYMFTIPKDWSDSHTPGKLLVTGRYSNAEFGAGPSLYAFGPWNHGNPPEPETQLDATCLMQYTFYERLNDYTGVDRWMGGAWLTSGKKSAVVLTGIKSIGDSWYGYENGTRMEECTYHNPPGNVDCSVLGQRGWWAEDYDGRILFYNPDDFASVVKGEKQPYDPQPYVVMNVDDYLFHLGTGNNEDSRIGGASYDRERGYLYVFELHGDGNKPLVHVWEIDKQDKIKHTLSDAIHLLRMLSGFSDNAPMVRDINLDSRVGLAEIIYVLQHIVKMSNME